MTGDILFLNERKTLYIRNPSAAYSQPWAIERTTPSGTFPNILLSHEVTAVLVSLESVAFSWDKQNMVIITADKAIIDTIL